MGLNQWFWKLLGELFNCWTRIRTLKGGPGKGSWEIGRPYSNYYPKLILIKFLRPNLFRVLAHNIPFF